MIYNFAKSFAHMKRWISAVIIIIIINFTNGCYADENYLSFFDSGYKKSYVVTSSNMNEIVGYEFEVALSATHESFVLDSGYLKENKVPSSNVLVIPHLVVSCDSTPVGAWISLDDDGEKLSKTKSDIQIPKRGNHKIIFALNDKVASKSYYVDESLEKIMYNFDSNKWKP